MKKSQLFVLACAAMVAISLRLVDRPMMNFSALGAFAVLCGATIRPHWFGLLAVLACRLVTDVALEMKTGYGFYSSMVFDYAAYAAMFTIGAWLRSKSVGRITGGTVLSAVTFFVLSNLGVWLMDHGGERLYPLTFDGLIECYTKAVPFAKGTFFGDLLFSAVFFGGLHFATGTSHASAVDVAAENP